MVKIGRGAPCRIATGTYTGDGAATHAITGLGFQPKAVQIHLQLDNQFVGRALKTDRDGLNAVVDDWAGLIVRYITDIIISLDADGFTVGDGTGFFNYFNALGWAYAFIAWS